MINATVKHALNSVLPDNFILENIREIFEKDAHNGQVTIQLDSEVIVFPIDEIVEIITKAYFDERFSIGFGVYRVEVAIGGVQKIEHGIIKPKKCFMTLYYNYEVKLTSCDFHLEFR